MSAAVGRNDRCPCGSGRRYKHCCGSQDVSSAADVAPVAAKALRALMREALAAQRARRLADAERLYREALRHAPENADALHMLGVIRYECKDYAEARVLIEKALDLTSWRLQAMRHNYGLVIARIGGERGARNTGQRRRYRDRSSLEPAVAIDPQPVGVVIPLYNHERFVEAALRSVYAQTWRDIELVVVDDGSTDRGGAIAAQVLAESPFPSRLVRRGNQGAAATINEGVAALATSFVAILNSDDLFAPGRIETMLAAVTRREASWGFSGVEFVGEDGAELDTLKHPRAYELTCAIAGIGQKPTVGFALLQSNVTVSTGNMFFQRRLWEEIGGFRDLRYNHDWDFALRALWLEEPCFVEEALYRYRLHGENTITETGGRDPALEAHRIVRAYIERSLVGEAPPNEFAPSLAAWGGEFAQFALESGIADALDGPLLRGLASECVGST